MKTQQSTEDHSKISPTAKLAAYWKAQSDIPYAEEIASSVEAEQTARQLADNLDSPMTSMSIPVMEARYKSINAAIAESGFTNVLEVASGLSPRGLALAADGGYYVGTDLPEISKEVFPVIRRIAEDENIPSGHLHFWPVDILDKSQLNDAASYFTDEPFALCNEGLLMYLDRSEKATVAQNIRELLLQTGGIWITTDLAFHETMFEAMDSEQFEGALKENIKNRLNRVNKETGRNFLENRFAGKSEALEFYKDCGFTLREYPMCDGSYELSTLPLIPDEAKEMILEGLSVLKVWILEAEE